MVMETRVGRPSIGPAVLIRFTPQQLAYIDQQAQAEQVPRAEWVREAVYERMRYPRQVLAQLVEWMVKQGIEPSEMWRAVSKPWLYGSWIAAARYAPQLSPEDLQPYEQQFTDTADHRDLVVRIVAGELPEDQDT